VQQKKTFWSCNDKNLAIANRSRVEIYVKGHSRSLETKPFIIHDLLLDELLDDEYYRDLEMWVRGHSRLLKLLPFESLGAVSDSPSIITMAVSVAVYEIFSVKEWCDLENRVTVRSRSSDMAPFDRSHTSSYSPSIVTMAIFCIVCEI